MICRKIEALFNVNRIFKSDSLRNRGWWNNGLPPPEKSIPLSKINFHSGLEACPSPYPQGNAKKRLPKINVQLVSNELFPTAVLHQNEGFTVATIFWYHVLSCEGGENIFHRRIEARDVWYCILPFFSSHFRHHDSRDISIFLIPQTSTIIECLIALGKGIAMHLWFNKVYIFLDEVCHHNDYQLRVFDQQVMSESVPSTTCFMCDQRIVQIECSIKNRFDWECSTNKSLNQWSTEAPF